MTLAAMAALTDHARRVHGGIGAFNVIALEHAEAIVDGAERAGSPVVLQLSQNTARYHRGLAPLALACLSIAADAATDVCVHLDHATDRGLVEEAVRLGIRSVMFDASALAHDANMEATAEVTSWCHQRAVWVEAELGEIGGKDGAHAPGARTDPAEAARFVAATGVDSLAVAVGSSHAMLTREAVLDEELIASLAAVLEVPLVLHGSSGVSEQGLLGSVAAGMVKINIATHLNKVFTATVRRELDSDPALVDPRAYCGPGRDAVADEVASLLDLLGGQRLEG